MSDSSKYAHYFRRALLEMANTDRELVWVSQEIPFAAMRAAYPLGIFPWPGNDPDLIPWVCPLERGVLQLSKFRLGRSTRRGLAKSSFRVSFNQAHREVIRACAEVPGRETWIHPKLVVAYEAAFRCGWLQSVEVWEGEALVGGLFGVDCGKVFSGESMFHCRDHAGKAAVAALVARLQARGDALLDIQQLTPHMAAMGAENWTREQYWEALGGI